MANTGRERSRLSRVIRKRVPSRVHAAAAAVGAVDPFAVKKEKKDEVRLL